MKDIKNLMDASKVKVRSDSLYYQRVNEYFSQDKTEPKKEELKSEPTNSIVQKRVPTVESQPKIIKQKVDINSELSKLKSHVDSFKQTQNMVYKVDSLRRQIENADQLKRVELAIQKGSMLLKQDIHAARSIYLTISPMYHTLAADEKKRVYPKILKFHTDLDRNIKISKIIKLLEELEPAIKGDNIKTISRVYEETKEEYSNLPEDLKLKLYDKMNHIANLVNRKYNY